MALTAKQRAEVIYLASQGKFSELLDKYEKYFSRSREGLFFELSSSEARNIYKSNIEGNINLIKGHYFEDGKFVYLKIEDGKRKRYYLIFRDTTPSASAGGVFYFPHEAIKALQDIATYLQGIYSLQKLYMEKLKLYDSDGGKIEGFE
ncbi:MAG: hypothetical protein N3E49_09495 [Bacteroidia bacterium]|nr:hypothetical protein [Bacteroidia bacterium]